MDELDNFNKIAKFIDTFTRIECAIIVENDPNKRLGMEMWMRNFGKPMADKLRAAGINW